MCISASELTSLNPMNSTVPPDAALVSAPFASTKRVKRDYPVVPPSQSVVCFYSKSKDAPFGRGENERAMDGDGEEWNEWAKTVELPNRFRRVLSNFYMRKFTFEGREWPSVEHVYQCYKFLVNLDVDGAFHDEVHGKRYPRDELVAMFCNDYTSAEEALKLGRHVRLSFTNIAVWDRASRAVMARASLAKFTQHPDLAAALLATGRAALLHTVSRKPFKDRFFHLEEIRAWLRRRPENDAPPRFTYDATMPATSPWRPS